MSLVETKHEKGVANESTHGILSNTHLIPLQIAAGRTAQGAWNTGIPRYQCSVDCRCNREGHIRMDGSSPWWDTCHMVKGCHCFFQRQHWEKKSCLWLTLVWLQSQQEHREDESGHPCTLRYLPFPPLSDRKEITIQKSKPNCIWQV